MAEGLAEQWLQQMSDRRLAERPDADRSHRDPNLTGGDVVADVVELGQRKPRPARPLVSQCLEPRRTRPHKGVFRDHEEGIHQHQDAGEKDEERLHFGARP